LDSRSEFLFERLLIESLSTSYIKVTSIFITLSFLEFEDPEWFEFEFNPFRILLSLSVVSRFFFELNNSLNL